MSGLPPYYVYIDESGDEGFQFDRGSSQWFILAACVVRGTNDRKLKELVDAIRAQVKGCQRPDLHFDDMTESRRLPYVNAIAAAPLRVVAILFQKPLMKDHFALGGQRLYFYATRFLLERVSKLCAEDRRKEAVGPAKIIFSNRSSTSYDDLRAYLDKLKTKDDCAIDWSVVDSKRVSTLQHRERAGLQVADAVASSFYTAVTKKCGVADDRYARILYPVAYRSNGERLGFGAKIWPHLSPTDEATYPWIEQYRKK